VSTTAPHSTADGVKFLEEGTLGRPLVVLIHGSLDRSAGMLRVSRQIQKVAQVIRFDRRGYAQNNIHQGPFSVAGNVDDVVSILNGREAILIGHSFGGNIALATAALLGEQIHAVSTYETPLSWFEWWPRNTAGANSLQVPTSEGAEAFMIRLIGQKRWSLLPETTKDARRSEGPALTAELQSIREGAPWSVEDIECPVLCGFGSRAMEHHKKGALWLGENLPNARSVEIDGAGHGAPNSHAAEFADLLIRPHLARVGSTD
jgi:pimeloyl-ACP methyl ester carboxylesterase